MAESIFRGPVVNLGAMMDGTTVSSPFDGPGINYQGQMWMDPRFAPARKDGLLPARIPGFVTGMAVTLVDQIPSLATATALVNASVATSGTAFALVTTALGGSAAGVPSFVPGVPLIPFGGTTVVTTNAIDFGFTTGTTTVNSSTVVVVDNTMFDNEQWIVIGGAGNAGKTAALVAQVRSKLSNGTGITISPVAAGSLDNAPIGQANLFGSNLIALGTQFGPATASANAVMPYRNVGLGVAFDPVQAVARSISVAAASVQGGTATILISGYDIYGVAMTELVTASGTTVVESKKAFKYVTSITPQANGSSTYNVTVGQAIGIPLRADRWGSIRVTFGNSLMATAAGFTAAVTTPANNTSGDVRGVLLLPLGGAAGTTNGTSRLVVNLNVPLMAMRNASPTASTSLFGVTQA